MQNSAGGGKNDRKTDGLSIRGKREFSQKSCRNTGGCSGKEKCLQGKVKITTVIIRDEAGSKAMKNQKELILQSNHHLCFMEILTRESHFCSVSVNSWKV